MSALETLSRERIGPDGEVTSLLDSIEVAPPKALEALNRSEIDMQVATAKKYPRSLGIVLREVETMATVDEETADKCFYRLKREDRRTGKTTWIVGPSVRFAEIVLCAWGNVRHNVRIIDSEGKFVVAQGTVFDLERNSLHSSESVRSITTREGKRYGADMIQTTAMAAASIALRNATFRVIPIGVFKSMLRKIDEVSLGKSETMDQRRAKVIEYFRSIGVSADRVLAVVERKTVDDITVDDLINLRGLARAIKDGETSIEEAFAPAAPAEQPKSAADKVAEAIASKKAATNPLTTVTAKPAEPSTKAPTDNPLHDAAAADWERTKRDGA